MGFVHSPPANHIVMLLNFIEESGYAFRVGLVRGDDLVFVPVYSYFALQDFLDLSSNAATDGIATPSLNGRILPSSMYSMTLSDLGMKEGPVLVLRRVREEKNEIEHILTCRFFTGMEKSSEGFVFSSRHHLCRMLNFAVGSLPSTSLRRTS